MRVMTCNVRFPTEKDGDNRWVHRKQLLSDVIRSYDPDIIGFQELWREQQQFMMEQLPSHAWFGMADTRDSNRPMNAIAWRDDRFQLVSPGGYWLSETPHVTGSRSWDSSNIRMANWVRLYDVNAEREFRFINTHLDHRGQQARPEQAHLINQDAEAFDDAYPQILTGDMNDTPDSAAINRFLDSGWRDTYEAVHQSMETGLTIHHFHGPDDPVPPKRIDWIFMRGPLKAHHAQVIRDNDNGRYPSDHYFVLADLDFKQA
ncbi:endonuclease/exonuclease/phosphatase family protein [Phycisphaerales bacterium AB-hyl4]|uniref:Endonuclease/exonuclease/phosphatase family protein n=1 Tax=Natronomicrosphaera hydrolytica TaxID=3242702 RepID=A0ABV4U4Y2_9BACT